ncbi:nuclear transport factor 2 family protein [Streptomyces sp. NRRL S-87]|uniref:nuclear transport factor 2 family protein n=1 Tax=Streptomyces sp. NRRL S-87 TaxID=1463920 RepID=UPI0007C5CBD2|nr:nuclear transport factor 2 family protein [Streptomyces sp. NRRL S-87]
MTTTPSVSETVKAYSEARFRGDVAAAAALTGDGFAFRSPFVTSHSPTGHLDGIEGLLGVVSGVEPISELYGEDEATLVYDLHTVSAVGITQRTAEHFRLRDGRIVAITLIFDSAPWQTLMAAAPDLRRVACGVRRGAVSPSRRRPRPCACGGRSPSLRRPGSDRFVAGGRPSRSRPPG